MFGAQIKWWNMYISPKQLPLIFQIKVSSKINKNESNSLEIIGLSQCSVKWFCSDNKRYFHQPHFWQQQAAVFRGKAVIMSLCTAQT